MIEKLVHWSKDNYSHLPWRNNRTLYSTLVSEIMLQQTTVSTVLNHFNRFLDEYPDVIAVANATDEQLTISWKGLGYYRRARNLKKACERFAKEFQGAIPMDRDTLLDTPGIGEYTAHALLSIGNDEPFLAVDANLERVLSRLYAIDVPKGPKLNKAIYNLFNQNKIAQDIYQVGGRDFNEALMDLGRNYCKIRNPDCALCPLSERCQARKQGKASYYPVVVGTKKKESFKLELLRVVVEKDDELLVYQKNNQQWLAGQWEIPTFILSSEDPSLKQYPHFKMERELVELLPSFKSLITKYVITNRVLLLSETELNKLGLRPSNSRYLKNCTHSQNLSTATIKSLKFPLFSPR
jgi:A/G-specific adenine glycosylase